MEVFEKHTSIDGIWIVTDTQWHLMIEHPNNNIHIFIDELRKGDTVYIHPEMEYHPSMTLQKIINAGMTLGIAINPGTSIEMVMEILVIVKKVLVMSVNPDNAGAVALMIEKSGG